MKRIVVVSLLIVAGVYINVSNAFCQDIPDAVTNTYKSKLYEVLEAKWEIKDSMYIASFEKGETHGRMFITSSGEWVKTVWSIPEQYIPKRIKEYVNAEYPDYKTTSTEIEYKTSGEFYLMGLKKGKDCPVLRFALNTEFVGVDSPASVTKQKAKKNSGVTDSNKNISQ